MRSSVDLIIRDGVKVNVIAKRLRKMQAGGVRPGSGVLFFQLDEDPVYRLFKSCMD